MAASLNRLSGATPSRTAYATALMRALHVHLDAAPPILDDRLSFELLPEYLQRSIKRRAAFRRALPIRLRPRDPAAAAMRGQVVVRARYAEDHPATQRWKQQLLSKRAITLPPNLTFQSVDFEHSSLADLWIDNDAADFISWLGTTYYLSSEGIMHTLKTLAARTQPGSQLVLDYWRESPGSVINPLLWGTRVAVALQGEPMRSFFDPAEIEKMAVEAGWRIKENCSPAEQRGRYLSNRKDRLRVPSFAYLLRLER